MAISFQCPTCQKPYKVKDELAGKKAECKQCKSVMNVPRQAVSNEDAHAVEALASTVLVEELHQQDANSATDDSTIKLECEYCFEAVEFPIDKGGKKAPCPSCRRIVQVPVQTGAKARKDWRAIQDNLTMARKNTEAAPEGAWGNAQLQQTIVSREALREAKVVVDRKTLMAPDRTKLYLTLAGLALVVGLAGFYFYRGKAADDRRLGLVADAIKEAPKLPSGWPAASHTACGEFYLHEEIPDLKSAKKQLQDARAAIRTVESPVDKAGLLAALVQAQAEFFGDKANAVDKTAMSLDEAKTQMRQTLQLCRELPFELGWIVVEDFTRKMIRAGHSGPLIGTVAIDAAPTEVDQIDARALASSLLHPGERHYYVFDSPVEVVASSTGEGVPIRLVALYVAAKKVKEASQMIPEPAGGDPTLRARLAYTEGYARGGEWEKANKMASANGTVEHKTCALAMLADAAADLNHAKSLESAVAFVAEQGKTFTLPEWAVMRIGRACGRAGRADLARQLAENVKLPNVTPWLDLAALQAELKTATGPLDSATVKVRDKSPAQALAWIALARHNAKVTRTDARQMLSAWPNEQAKAAGLAGAALGIQDR